MTRASSRLPRRLMGQSSRSLVCDPQRQPPLRGRAAAVAGQRAQVRATQCVVPKRAVVSVDDRFEGDAIAAPINDSAQLSPALKPSPADEALSTQGSFTVNQEPSMSPEQNLLQRFNPVWVGWLLIALLLSAWFIVKTVMV